MISFLPLDSKFWVPWETTPNLSGLLGLLENYEDPSQKGGGGSLYLGNWLEEAGVGVGLKMEGSPSLLPGD